MTIDTLPIAGAGAEAVPNRLMRRAAAPSRSLALLFPGFAYGNDFPLLALAAQVLAERGYDVLLLDYDYPRRGARLDTPEGQADLLARLRADAEAAAAAAHRAYPGLERLLLLGKSLGTHALATLAAGDVPGWAAELDLVWLTPLCESRAVAEAMRRAPGRALVVIGTADPHHREDTIAPLRTERRVVEIAGADHALEVPGSSAATLAALAAWRRALDQFVAREAAPYDVASRWMREVWQERRTEAIDELHDAAFVDRSPSGRPPDRASYRRGVEELFAAFPDFRAETDALLEDAATGLLTIRWSAHGTHRGPFLGVPPTGRRVAFRGIEILRVADGRIAERWGEWDGLDLLEQLRR